MHAKVAQVWGLTGEQEGVAGKTDSSGHQVLSQEARDSTFLCGTQKYTFKSSESL